MPFDSETYIGPVTAPAEALEPVKLKPSEILDRAADLICVREGGWFFRPRYRTAWTIGARALDIHGNFVPASSSSAVKFCAVGAIERIAGEDYSAPSVSYANQALGGDIIGYNDSYAANARSVAKALHKAAKLARSYGD